MAQNTIKIALITGSSRGLGRHTALALAQKGVDVIVRQLMGQWSEN